MHGVKWGGVAATEVCWKEKRCREERSEKEREKASDG